MNDPLSSAAHTHHDDSSHHPRAFHVPCRGILPPAARPWETFDAFTHRVLRIRFSPRLSTQRVRHIWCSVPRAPAFADGAPFYACNHDHYSCCRDILTLWHDASFRNSSSATPGVRGTEAYPPGEGAPRNSCA